MYFRVKNTLKSNYHHTFKYPLLHTQNKKNKIRSEEEIELLMKM